MPTNNPDDAMIPADALVYGVYRGRVFVLPSSPGEWFMSKVDDPTNWSFPEDSEGDTPIVVEGK